MWGIFSYFPSRKPNDKDLEDCKFVLLTPDGPEWNPHSDSYARNEEQYLDWKGEIIPPKDRQHVLIEDSDSDAFLGSLNVDLTKSELSAGENLCIDNVYGSATVMSTEAAAPSWDKNNSACDEVYSTLRGISNTLDPCTFATELLN